MSFFESQYPTWQSPARQDVTPERAEPSILDVEVDLYITEHDMGFSVRKAPDLISNCGVEGLVLIDSNLSEIATHHQGFFLDLNFNPHENKLIHSLLYQKPKNQIVILIPSNFHHSASVFRAVFELHPS